MIFSYELENTLKNDNKLDLLEKVSHISNIANIYYVRQNMPLGLGHAVLKAKSFIGDAPFVIALEMISYIILKNQLLNK